ncbi:MAG: YdcF family protein [Clostridiales bacterium]|nr:YdcF family protein [Clostridiales bacterium]
MKKTVFLSQIDLSDEAVADARIDGVLFDEAYETAEKSDYAILLGTSPEFAAARAEIAAAYYRAGGTEHIIASGAAVSDKSVTEAAFMRDELIKRGVPQSAVIEEANAYDTIQNMTCSLTEMCKRCDIMQVKTVTVITEPFHMKRSLHLARLLLPQFIAVRGFTQGVARQREAWRTDGRLRECVKTEIRILRELIAKGRVEDIAL